MSVLCAWIPRRGAYSARFTFFLTFLTTFSKYPELEIRTFGNSSFRLPKGRTSSLRRLFPAGGWADSSLRTCFLVVWGLSTVLLPLLRIHCRAIVSGSRGLFPAAGWAYSLRRNFPHAPEVQIRRLRRCHCRSLFQVAFLNPLWHGALFPDRIRKKRAKMAAGKLWKVHDVYETKKMVPLVTCEVSFGQYVSELVLGVNMFGLDLGVQIDSVKQPINLTQLCEFLKRVSLFGLLSLMIILITTSLSSNMCNWDSPWEECAFVVTGSTCDNWSTSRFPFCLGLDLWVREQFHAASWVEDSVLFDERNTSVTTSHKSKAGSPSILKIISYSVQPWDTDVCLLHIQPMGANVRLPNLHKMLPEVDFESSRSPAKSEPWKKPNRQCWAVLPTWQYCR